MRGPAPALSCERDRLRAVVPLGKRAARLTPSEFVVRIAASIGRTSIVPPATVTCAGARMRHHSSIADSRPGAQVRPQTPSDLFHNDNGAFMREPVPGTVPIDGLQASGD